MLIVVIVLIVYAIRALARRDVFSNLSKPAAGKKAEETEEALRILAERFARGEISAEEYRTMKDELKK